MKRILHLTLLRKWFDLIASGEKTEEYRTWKPYWFKRLCKNGEFIKFDEIHFRNGYHPNCPFMRVEHLGTVYDKDNDRFILKLGRILDKRD